MRILPGAAALLCLFVSHQISAQVVGPRLRLDGEEYFPGSRLPLPAELATAPEPFPERKTLGLVEFVDAINEQDLEALRQLGLDPLQYLPERNYFVHGPQAALAAAAQLNSVKWAGPFPPALKLSGKLRTIAAAQASTPTPDSDELDVIVQTFDVGDVEELRQLLHDAGGREIWLSRPGRRIHLRVMIPASLLTPLARWPSVFRLEEMPELRLLNERALVATDGAFPAADLCVVPGHEEWLNRKGLRGVGSVVHLMDDGIEQGNASGIPGTSHPDLLGAIAGVDNATSDPLADSRAGHGSLNASLLVGRGETPWRDDQGFALGLGMVPGATVYATKIFNNLGRFDVGTRSFMDLVKNASQRSATISSNSWGSSSFGAYDALAVEFDALTRDANPLAGLQPMAFVFAAGNAGDDVPGGVASIGSPATAKNVIAVGATESCDAQAGDGCGIGPLEANSIRDVPQFSSRGPLADGRQAPTLVAPGTHMSGVASTAIGYDGSGLCDPFWPLGQVLYARGSGTSHACPLVAGGAALFHEWFLARTGSAPSPALVRAALTAAAQSLAGGNDGFGGQIGHVPSPIQGWGRLRLDDLLPEKDAAPRALFFDQETLLTDVGDTWETIVFPLDTTGPVRVALAWSDPAAVPGAAPTLVNNLDLEVESNGELYRGNALQGGVSTPMGEPDRLNNLECVFLDRPGPILRVRVRAAAINGDGAPAGDSTDQDFALAVLGGTLQSSRGVVSFSRPRYSCNSTIGIVVTDLDLKGRPSVQVTVSSSAAAQPVVATLTEATERSGVFDGSIQLGPEIGQLLAADPGTLTVRYLDADDGTGSATESVAVATFDCLPPVISQLEIRELSESSAVIAWTTSEDASGKVRLGTGCVNVSQEVLSPRRAQSHAVTLSGLVPGTAHYFVLEATDAVGNTASDDRQGACHTFHTSAFVCVFEDDVEPQPVPGWTHSAEQGPDDWAPATFPGAHSPTHTWHARGFDGFKDAALVTPPLDIEVGDRFSFWHTFQLEKGYDGAVLEISTNDGASWSDLGPFFLRGGYSEVVTGSPFGERLAWTGRRDEVMSQVEVDLSAWAGASRWIRFRLGTDASSVDGFGWHIDDVELCRTLNKRGLITLDRQVYRCEDQVHVRVHDLDLVGLGTTPVVVSSTSNPVPREFTLIETGLASGIFALSIPLGAGPGSFVVADGDQLSVSHEDIDDGSGLGPKSTAATASVDCVAPVIAKVRIVDLFDDEATIAWETSEAAVAEILAGPGCDNLPVRVPCPLGGTTHLATLRNLEASTSYRFKIQVRDRAGNASVDDADGVCRHFRPTIACVERWDFDDGAAGWTHVAAIGKDDWRLEAAGFVRTPPTAWFLPGASESSDVALHSPFFTVPQGASLAFWHSYELEPTFDGAVLEITTDGGQTWQDVGAQIRRGPYTTTLVPPSALAGRRAWSGGKLGPLERVVASLEPWIGHLAMVRFRVVSDASVGGAGWIIDRVEICQGVGEKARLALDKRSYACSDKVRVQVFDTGRIGVPDAFCEISSSSDLIPKRIALIESSAGSGIFAGEINLVTSETPGQLVVSEADAVRVSYRDDDDGTGAAREVQAIAAVDCTPPVISAIGVESLGSTSATIVLRTDESATARVRHGSTCADLALTAVSARPGKEHRLALVGLGMGKRYFFQVEATDEAGNTTVDTQPDCRSFHTRVSYRAFEDTLQPNPQSNWDDAARWQVVDSELAASVTRAWAIRGNGLKTDAALTLPPLRVPPESTLELWHTFELPAGRAGGIIEASQDGGQTWIDLETDILEGRYTSFLLPGNALEGRRAWTGGRLGPMTRVRVSLGKLVGEDILVRLRWASQSVSAEAVWLVDDIRVTADVGEDAFVGFDSPVYSCNQAVVIRLADSTLVGQKTQRLEVTSTSQLDPIAVELVETLPGFFQGTLLLSGIAQAGSLLAVDGDELRASYSDLFGENKQPRVVTSTARVDCLPPVITNFRFGSAGVSMAQVLWETSEPAFGRVLFGPNCTDLSSATASQGHLLSHLATLEGLDPEARVTLKVESRDLAGNRANSTDCAGFAIQRACGFEDPLEPPQAGWTHSAALGRDSWEVVEFDRSRSPKHSFQGANTGEPRDARLHMPTLDLEPGSVLSFWHTFELEEGFDGATLEISTDEGASWQSLGADIFEGQYTGTIATLDGPIAGWTGGTIQDMKSVRVALDRYAGPGRRIRFRLLCDDSVGTPGWYIDDVSVCTYFSQAEALSFARGNCNADGLLNLSDAIFLLNHLFLGGAVPSCRKACDADANDALNITDAVYLLAFLFQGGRPLAPPLGCAPDLSGGELECNASACLAE